MKRRDNIKLIIAGSIGTGLMLNQSCKSDVKPKDEIKTSFSYGRTAEEIAIDKKLMEENFLSPEEKKTLTILSDIIIPADEISGSASQAGVVDFIEFMLKDQPTNQLPIRGGLKWLDNKCLSTYNSTFMECSASQQMEIVDLIAYPDRVTEEMKPGAKFFTLVRNLVTTGFFTSELGLKDLGYVGNRPNEWDGVPDEVLKKHGLSYDARTLEICVKMKDRNVQIQWDAEGNVVG